MKCIKWHVTESNAGGFNKTHTVVFTQCSLFKNKNLTEHHTVLGIAPCRNEPLFCSMYFSPAAEAHFKEAHRRFISKGVIYMLALPFFREHQFKISRLELWVCASVYVHIILWAFRSQMHKALSTTEQNECHVYINGEFVYYADGSRRCWCHVMSCATETYWSIVFCEIGTSPMQKNVRHANHTICIVFITDKMWKWLNSSASYAVLMWNWEG